MDSKLKNTIVNLLNDEYTLEITRGSAGQGGIELIVDIKSSSNILNETNHQKEIIDELQEWWYEEFCDFWQADSDVGLYSHTCSFYLDKQEGLCVKVLYWGDRQFGFEDCCFFMYTDDFCVSKKIMGKLNKIKDINWDEDSSFEGFDYRFSYENGIFKGDFEINFYNQGNFIELDFDSEDIKILKSMIKKNIIERDYDIYPFEKENRNIIVECEIDNYYPPDNELYVAVTYEICHSIEGIENDEY